jgi:hypothetical protein
VICKHRLGRQLFGWNARDLHLDGILVREHLGNSSPGGREQSQEGEEKLPAWGPRNCQLIMCVGESKRTRCAHNSAGHIITRSALVPQGR